MIKRLCVGIAAAVSAIAVTSAPLAAKPDGSGPWTIANGNPDVELNVPRS